jgi:hypothetical protein
MISTNLLRSRSTIAAIAGALIALVALFGSTAQAAPQISNGSFEAGISQWTVDFGDVDVVSGWQAADGSQSIDLNGSSATPPEGRSVSLSAPSWGRSTPCDSPWLETPITKVS